MSYHAWRRGSRSCLLRPIPGHARQHAEKTEWRANCSADFFTSGINLRLPVAIALMVALYILSYLFWAFIWLLVYWSAQAP
jgi:hypothetical protein